MNPPETSARPSADSLEREAPSGVHGLAAVFRPRSIAVIGASRERGSVGAEIFHNLIHHQFAGPVYPVNPKASSVLSVRAYARVEDVPDPLDLAIIVVPAVHVLSVLEACGRKGVRAAVVISAGFKETGEEGLARERALLDCARRHHMRLVGPNCLGVLSTAPEMRMDATFAPVYPPAGPVAFSSQSGALGLAILDYAAQLNIGISDFISVGNKADVSGNDLLEYWEADPRTKVVLLYLESLGNPRRFLEIARRVSRTKPIAAVKSGRTRAGMRAAASHTGSLAGPDAAVDAMCRQSGVIRTDTIEELFDIAMLVANQPMPRGNRVGIVTNAGGPGILASDACESRGLTIPPLEEATVAGLRTFLPREASTRNPVDMIASARPESFERAVELVSADPNVDSLLVIYVPPIVTTPEAVAQAIVRGAASAALRSRERGEAPKPVISCFMGAHGIAQGLQSLHSGSIPSYPFPESAAIALSRAARYGAWLAEPEGRPVRFDDVDAEAGRRAIAAAAGRSADTDGGAVATSWLRPAEVTALLEAYGLRGPRSEVAASEAATVACAERIGFPVAVKLASETLTHKSDVGGVVLDVRSAAEAAGAYRAIASRVEAAGRAHEMSGVLVQQMVKQGIEAVIGVTRDPSFGPLIMFGLGGVQVELLKDVSFRVHPLTDADARDMVRSIRGYALLEGWRGAPAGDVARLEETILRISQMLDDHPGIEEMDLNPVKVLGPGDGCIVVDARVSVRRAS